MTQELSVNTRKNVEARMNQLLERLGLNFTVQWRPDPAKKTHGNINLNHGIIHIYDKTESAAWTTLEHEVLELGFRKVTTLYQNVINNLIAIIEKEVYNRKESFLESLPLILKEFEKETRT